MGTFLSLPDEVMYVTQTCTEFLGSLLQTIENMSDFHALELLDQN